MTDFTRPSQWSSVAVQAPPGRTASVLSPRTPVQEFSPALREYTVLRPASSVEDATRPARSYSVAEERESPPPDTVDETTRPDAS